MTTTTDDVLDDKIIAACDRLMKQFCHCVNLTGIDVGFAWKNGRPTRKIALRLHVIAKIPPRFLHPKTRFPRQFDGYQVDVMEARCDGASTFARPDNQSWLNWFEQTVSRRTEPEINFHEPQTPEQFQQTFCDLLSPSCTKLPTQPATSPDVWLLSSQWPNSPDNVLPCHPNPFPRMEPSHGRIRPNNPVINPPSNRDWAVERLLAKWSQTHLCGTLVPEHREAKNAVALRQKISLMAFIWPNLKTALFAESPCFTELLPETTLVSLGLPNGAVEWVVSAVNFWPAFEEIALQVTSEDFANADDFLDVLTSLHRVLRKLGYDVI